MNVEYIWLSSHYAMQIKVSSAVTYDFNQLLCALCAPPLIEDLENISHPPHRFLALPRPVSPREKKTFLVHPCFHPTLPQICNCFCELFICFNQ